MKSTMVKCAALVLGLAFVAVGYSMSRKSETSTSAASLPDDIMFEHVEVPAETQLPAADINFIYSFSCVHCYQLHEKVSDLAKSKNKVIKFTPAIRGEGDLAFAALHIALAETNQLEKGFPIVFNAVFEKSISDIDGIIQELKDQGVDTDAVQKILADESITQKLKDTRKITSQLEIVGVPFILIDGERKIQMENASDYDAVVNFVSSALDSKIIHTVK